MMGTEGNWPLCGEIDILETKNTQDQVESTVHWADETSPDYAVPLTQYLTQRSSGHTTHISDKTDWHTYGVYKAKTHLAFYGDGQRHFLLDITGPLQTELHQDCYVLFNLACGGQCTEGKLPSRDLEARMEVDYLRYNVPADAWFSDAVAWAQETQLMPGYGNRLFGAADPITLVQMDLVIRRNMGQDPAWPGDPAPENATRAQVAQALYDLLHHPIQL